MRQPIKINYSIPEGEQNTRWKHAPRLPFVPLLSGYFPAALPELNAVERKHMIEQSRYNLVRSLGEIAAANTTLDDESQLVAVKAKTVEPRGDYVAMMYLEMYPELKETFWEIEAQVIPIMEYPSYPPPNRWVEVSLNEFTAAEIWGHILRIQVDRVKKWRFSLETKYLRRKRKTEGALEAIRPTLASFLIAAGPAVYLYLARR